MIEAMIGGKLHGKPERRTAKSGKPYTLAKVRVLAGNSTITGGVVAFAEPVQAALLALDDGEPVALAGSLTIKPWIDREGRPRAGFDLIANAVLTLHHAKRLGEDFSPPTERTL